MPNVSFQRADYEAALPVWDLIRATLQGEITVKLGGDRWLPRPNPKDTGPENVARYAAYLLRAVFYNVTKRTSDGLVGQVFMRPATIELPELLQNMIADADGSGVSLEQLGKDSLRSNINFGRAGLLTDFPVTDGEASVADLEKGDIRPTITQYEPWHIINWRTTKRGARSILSLVVLVEEIEDNEDQFETVLVKQFRILELINDVYTVTIFREEEKDFAIHGDPFVPLDVNGNTLDEIPFEFIGAEDNDPDIDEAPMYPVASLNMAHYRNSADYEEAVYIVGQPTPYFSGVTEEWVKNVMKNIVELGSRAAIPLPVGGVAGLLQAEERGMSFEAMTHKEKQMVTLGAKLIEPATVERTATETIIDKASENSVLATSTQNVNDAMTRSLIWAARFMGAAETEIKFMLNTDFTSLGMSPEERRQLVLEWSSGLITFPEARNILRQNGVATEEDAAAQILIEAEQLKKAEAEAAAKPTPGLDLNDNPPE